MSGSSLASRGSKKAVVCWALSGAVAVVGRLFIDSPDEAIFAKAEITYFKGDVVGATSQHNVQGSGTANTLVNVRKSGGFFTKVRLRLFRNGTLVHTKNMGS